MRSIVSGYSHRRGKSHIEFIVWSCSRQNVFSKIPSFSSDFRVGSEDSRSMAATSNSGGRKKPNILITGTPGTGKTTMASALAEATQLRHINVGELVKQKNLHDGWDDQFDCYIINEDLVNFPTIF